MADDAPDLTEDLDDEAPDDVTPDDFMREAYDIYQARTSRLRVYGSLVRAILPPIGRTAISEGQEIDVDPDLETARNLAAEALFAAIRQIAIDDLHGHGEDSR